MEITDKDFKEFIKFRINKLEANKKKLSIEVKNLTTEINNLKISIKK